MHRRPRLTDIMRRPRTDAVTCLDLGWRYPMSVPPLGVTHDVNVTHARRQRCTVSLGCAE